MIDRTSLVQCVGDVPKTISWDLLVWFSPWGWKGMSSFMQRRKDFIEKKQCSVLEIVEHGVNSGRGGSWLVLTNWNKCVEEANAILVLLNRTIVWDLINCDLIFMLFSDYFPFKIYKSWLTQVIWFALENMDSTPIQVFLSRRSWWISLVPGGS